MRLSLFVLVTMFVSSTSWAELDWETRILAALAQAELEDSGQYTYVQTVLSEDDDIQVTRFDPRADPQWQLLTINGEQPTEKDIKKYRKDKTKEAERREDEDRLVDMVVPGSLSVMEQTEEWVTFAFTPVLDNLPEKALPFLEGELVWSLQADALSSVTISNSEPFSPAVSVKVNAMRMHFEFADFEGVTIPQQIQFTFEGKFAGLKRFDVDSIVEFSQIKRVQ